MKEKIRIGIKKSAITHEQTCAIAESF
jgi:hypothetical protein